MPAGSTTVQGQPQAPHLLRTETNWFEFKTTFSNKQTPTYYTSLDPSKKTRIWQDAAKHPSTLADALPNADDAFKLVAEKLQHEGDDARTSQQTLLGIIEESHNKLPEGFTLADIINSIFMATQGIKTDLTWPNDNPITAETAKTKIAYLFARKPSFVVAFIQKCPNAVRSLSSDQLRILVLTAPIVAQTILREKDLREKLGEPQIFSLAADEHQKPPNSEPTGLAGANTILIDKLPAYKKHIHQAVYGWRSTGQQTKRHPGLFGMMAHEQQDWQAVLTHERGKQLFAPMPTDDQPRSVDTFVRLIKYFPNDETKILALRSQSRWLYNVRSETNESNEVTPADGFLTRTLSKLAQTFEHKSNLKKFLTRNTGSAISQSPRKRILGEMRAMLGITEASTATPAAVQAAPDPAAIAQQQESRSAVVATLKNSTTRGVLHLTKNNHRDIFKQLIDADPNDLAFIQVIIQDNAYLKQIQTDLNRTPTTNTNANIYPNNLRNNPYIKAALAIKVQGACADDSNYFSDRAQTVRGFWDEGFLSKNYWKNSVTEPAEQQAIMWVFAKNDRLFKHVPDNKMEDSPFLKAKHENKSLAALALEESGISAGHLALEIVQRELALSAETPAELLRLIIKFKPGGCRPPVATDTNRGDHDDDGAANQGINFSTYLTDNSPHLQRLNVEDIPTHPSLSADDLLELISQYSHDKLQAIFMAKFLTIEGLTGGRLLGWMSSEQHKNNPALQTLFSQLLSKPDIDLSDVTEGMLAPITDSNLIVRLAVAPGLFDRLKAKVEAIDAATDISATLTILSAQQLVALGAKLDDSSVKTKAMTPIAENFNNQVTLSLLIDFEFAATTIDPIAAQRTFFNAMVLSHSDLCAKILDRDVCGPALLNQLFNKHPALLVSLIQQKQDTLTSDQWLNLMAVNHPGQPTENVTAIADAHLIDDAIKTFLQKHPEKIAALFSASQFAAIKLKHFPTLVLSLLTHWARGENVEALDSTVLQRLITADTLPTDDFDIAAFKAQCGPHLNDVFSSELIFAHHLVKHIALFDDFLKELKNLNAKIILAKFFNPTSGNPPFVAPEALHPSMLAHPEWLLVLADDEAFLALADTNPDLFSSLSNALIAKLQREGTANPFAMPDRLFKLVRAGLLKQWPAELYEKYKANVKTVFNNPSVHGSDIAANLVFFQGYFSDPDNHHALDRLSLEQIRALFFEYNTPAQVPTQQIPDVLYSLWQTHPTWLITLSNETGDAFKTLLVTNQALFNQLAEKLDAKEHPKVVGWLKLNQPAYTALAQHFFMEHLATLVAGVLNQPDVATDDHLARLQPAIEKLYSPKNAVQLEALTPTATQRLLTSPATREVFHAACASNPTVFAKLLACDWPIARDGEAKGTDSIPQQLIADALNERIMPHLSLEHVNQFFELGNPEITIKLLTHFSALSAEVSQAIELQDHADALLDLAEKDEQLLTNQDVMFVLKQSFTTWLLADNDTDRAKSIALFNMDNARTNGLCESKEGARTRCTLNEAMFKQLLRLGNATTLQVIFSNFKENPSLKKTLADPMIFQNQDPGALSKLLAHAQAELPPAITSSAGAGARSTSPPPQPLLTALRKIDIGDPKYFVAVSKIIQKDDLQRILFEDKESVDAFKFYMQAIRRDAECIPVLLSHLVGVDKPKATLEKSARAGGGGDIKRTLQFAETDRTTLANQLLFSADFTLARNQSSADDMISLAAFALVAADGQTPAQALLADTRFTEAHTGTLLLTDLTTKATQVSTADLEAERAKAAEARAQATATETRLRAEADQAQRQAAAAEAKAAESEAKQRADKMNAQTLKQINGGDAELWNKEKLLKVSENPEHAQAIMLQGKLWKIIGVDTLIKNVAKKAKLSGSDQAIAEQLLFESQYKKARAHCSSSSMIFGLCAYAGIQDDKSAMVRALYERGFFDTNQDGEPNNTGAVTRLFITHIPEDLLGTISAASSRGPTPAPQPTEAELIRRGDWKEKTADELIAAAQSNQDTASAVLEYSIFWAETLSADQLLQVGRSAALGQNDHSIALALLCSPDFKYSRNAADDIGKIVALARLAGIAGDDATVKQELLTQPGFKNNNTGQFVNSFMPRTPQKRRPSATNEDRREVAATTVPAAMASLPPKAAPAPPPPPAPPKAAPAPPPPPPPPAKVAHAAGAGSSTRVPRKETLNQTQENLEAVRMNTLKRALGLDKPTYLQFISALTRQLRKNPELYSDRMATVEYLNTLVDPKPELSKEDYKIKRDEWFNTLESWDDAIKKTIKAKITTICDEVERNQFKAPAAPTGGAGGTTGALLQALPSHKDTDPIVVNITALPEEDVKKILGFEQSFKLKTFVDRFKLNKRHCEQTGDWTNTTVLEYLGKILQPESELAQDTFVQLLTDLTNRLGKTGTNQAFIDDKLAAIRAHRNAKSAATASTSSASATTAQSTGLMAGFLDTLTDRRRHIADSEEVEKTCMELMRELFPDESEYPDAQLATILVDLHADTNKTQVLHTSQLENKSKIIDEITSILDYIDSNDEAQWEAIQNMVRTQSAAAMIR